MSVRSRTEQIWDAARTLIEKDHARACAMSKSNELIVLYFYTAGHRGDNPINTHGKQSLLDIVNPRGSGCVAPRISIPSWPSPADGFFLVGRRDERKENSRSRRNGGRQKPFVQRNHCSLGTRSIPAPLTSLPKHLGSLGASQ
jgi:hypothetical protein